MGLGGVISKPYRGGLRNGPRGLARGLVQGALCVLKPPIGVFDLLTKVSCIDGLYAKGTRAHMQKELIRWGGLSERARVRRQYAPLCSTLVATKSDSICKVAGSISIERWIGNYLYSLGYASCGLVQGALCVLASAAVSEAPSSGAEAPSFPRNRISLLLRSPTLLSSRSPLLRSPLLRSPLLLLVTPQPPDSRCYVEENCRTVPVVPLFL